MCNFLKNFIVFKFGPLCLLPSRNIGTPYVDHMKEYYRVLHFSGTILFLFFFCTETGPDHTNDGLSFQDPSRNADGFDGQFAGPAGLKSYGAALVEANGSEADVSKLYVNHGQPQEPLLFQGNDMII